MRCGRLRFERGNSTKVDKMSRSQPPNSLPTNRRLNPARREASTAAPMRDTQPPRRTSAVQHAAAAYAASGRHAPVDHSIDNQGYHYPPANPQTYAQQNYDNATYQENGPQEQSGLNYPPTELHEGGTFPDYPMSEYAGRIEPGFEPGPHYPPHHDTQAYDLSQYSATGPRAYHSGVPAGHVQQGRYQQPVPGGFGADLQPAYAGRGAHYDEQHANAYAGSMYSQPVDPRQATRDVAYENQEYDEDPYYDEPRKTSRVWVLTAALIGSIAVGGGLAYGYKSFMGSEGKPRPAVVRAAKTPMKVPPSDPGGRKLAGSESKVMGRLEADGGAGAGTTFGAADSNGVRKVSTITVGRDGSISPGTMSNTQGASQPEIPGFEIVDGFGGGSTKPPAQEIGSPQPKVITRSPGPGSTRQPISVSKVTTIPSEGLSEGPSTGAPASDEQAVARKPSIKRPEKVASLTPKAPVEQSPTRGFVAVLSSKGSRMAALQAFAEMREKFPDVLGSKIPDVQSSDQSTRGLGTVYRAVAGPPGSRQAASIICQQLKAAGHQGGCWVTAY